jgi:hypothetical protein
MALKHGVKYTIGKESKSAPGTAVARSAVLPISDIGSLDRDITKKTDPLIAGLGMDSGEYAVSADVKGGIPLSPRPCAGWGMVLKGIFGTEATPVEIMGQVRIRYTGSSGSCKIVCDVTGKTIKSYIGVAGSETLDTNFGTGGTITLTATGNDTLTELVALIDAYTDYEAVLVNGLGSGTIASVKTATYQAKGKWAFLWLTGSGSGAYLHQFTPDLTLGTERDPWSIQVDGAGDNYLYAGNYMNKLSLSAALKADLEADLDVLGMTETAGQTASALTAPTGKPYKFGAGFTSLAGTKYSETRKHAVAFGNSMLEDGYGQDSLDRSYVERGKFVIDGGEVQLRLTATSILERPKAETGERVPMQFLYFEVENSFLLSVKGCMLIELPYAEISETPKRLANGDILDLDIKFKAFNPGGATDYEPPAIVSILTSDSAAY